MCSPEFHKISSLESYVINNTQRVYDALFCDIWGVIHNGVTVFESTVDALIQFRHEGGSVVLVSNAPRSGSTVQQYLAHLSVPHEAFDAIVTSGDVTTEEIKHRKGAPVFYLGPPKDHEFLSELGISSSPLEQAAYVLCTGLKNDILETPDDYKESLEYMRARDLPMVCANPDRMVRRGATLVYCAGALAEAYSALGGHVIYTGKPYPPIYNLSFEVLARLRNESVPRSRILVIGDSIETDIHGARNMGLDSLFVYSGIHTSDLSALKEEDHIVWFKDQINTKTHPKTYGHEKTDEQKKNFSENEKAGPAETREPHITMCVEHCHSTNVRYALMPKVLW